MSGDSLAAALDYAARGWPIYPQNPRNRHGYFVGAKDAATTDPTVIRTWAARYPDMAIAVLTGGPSGIVALDVDIKNGVDGRDTLEMDFGVALHPASPTDHSPSGGYHILFSWPGRLVKSGPIGRGLEVKGDGLWITLPPGPGRYWDPILDLTTTPIAPMPAWLLAATAPPAEEPRSAAGPRYVGKLSPYGAAALDAAVKRIVEAGPGKQEVTLNGEAFSIGQLAGGNVIPAGLALDGLLWAAQRMPSFDKHRPWRAVELERKVKAAFTDGLHEPREAPHG
jgi:hypothetical protein